MQASMCLFVSVPPVAPAPDDPDELDPVPDPDVPVLVPDPGVPVLVPDPDAPVANLARIVDGRGPAASAPFLLAHAENVDASQPRSAVLVSI